MAPRRVTGMKINGKGIAEAKLNNEIVFKKEKIVGPIIDVEGLENGIVISANPQTNVNDTVPFITYIYKNGEFVQSRNSQRRTDTSYYDRFGIGWQGVGTFTFKAVNENGGVTEITFEVKRP